MFFTLPLPRLALAAAAGLLAIFAQVRADEAAMAQSVVNKVYARETITDEITPFRLGSAPRIVEAMNQYLATQAEHAATRPARLIALRWALEQYVNETARFSYAKSSRSQNFSGSVTSFGEDTYKCNKLAADSYAHGANRGLSLGTTWDGEGGQAGWPAKALDGSQWPPTANTLASLKTNPRNLTPAVALRSAGVPSSFPDLGDLIVFPLDGGHGHVGLYLGKDLIISAKASGIEVGTIEKEREEHGGIVRVRKFIDRLNSPILVPTLTDIPAVATGDSALAAKIRALVRQRTTLQDGFAGLRSGANERIDTVMSQYLEVQTEFAGKTPARLKALRWALERYVDESTRAGYARDSFHGAQSNSVSAFDSGILKTAKFVADTYATGASQGLSTGATFGQSGYGTGWPALAINGATRPPGPNLLGDTGANVRSLSNARPLRMADEPKASPELGDLIIFPDADGNGHAGLYLGKDLIISAQSGGVEITDLNREQAAYDGICRIRKFNGSGR